MKNIKSIILFVIVFILHFELAFGENNDSIQKI